jgi:hypothetical protein
MQIDLLLAKSVCLAGSTLGRFETTPIINRVDGAVRLRCNF